MFVRQINILTFFIFLGADPDPETVHRDMAVFCCDIFKRRGEWNSVDYMIPGVLLYCLKGNLHCTTEHEHINTTKQNIKTHIKKVSPLVPVRL